MLSRAIYVFKSSHANYFNKNIYQNGFNFLLSSKFSSEADIHKKIDEIVKSDRVVLFMKGTPEEPLCGFSNAVVRILQIHGVDHYCSVNVLEDENIRSGVKSYSQWQTIPQVFIGGEFVGGCDIILELHKSGGLIEELNKVGLKSALSSV